MPQEATQADSSTAEAVDVFNGAQPTMEEFSRYRENGELPARFKPAENADSAPADTQEETEQSEDEESETESESETDEAQEQPHKGSGAEKRIKQLLAKTKELESKLAAKQDVKTDPSPAPRPQYAHPKPTAEDKNPDGTLKYEVYEDLTEAIGRWAAKEERTAWEREHEQKEAHKALQKQVDEARSRYDDVDDVIFPAAKAINEAAIPVAVKEVFGQSDLFIDLCYKVGSDPDELKKFISLAQTNPRAAIGKVFEYERAIQEENSKARDDKGQFKSKEAPEVKKTSAPKPPSPVGGASSRAFDVSDESLSPEEWMRKRNQDLQKKRG